MGMGRRVFLVCLVAVALVVPSCKDGSSSSKPRVSCTISMVVPDTGNAEGGTAIVITGSGFENDPSLAVVIGANAVPGSWISETTVLATMPPDTRLPTGGPVISNSDDKCTISQIVTKLRQVGANSPPAPDWSAARSMS